jgi:hypothetical protein
MRDGFGMLDSESLQYRGGFEEGLFSRYGALIYGANREIRYDGFFREGEKWGWGHARFETMQFRGCFRDDVPHGTFAESVLLEGSWHECQSGYHHGKLLWRTSVHKDVKGTPSDILAAETKKRKIVFGNKPHHNFKVVDIGENRRYMGETSEGKIEGLGIESVDMEDGSCELYAGRFCDGLRHGHGVILRGMGDFYVGSFEDGLPHGVGFDLSQETYYVGEMQVRTHMQARALTRVD